MQVYLVGGAVRDQLLGRAIKERDYVVVGATPELLIEQGYQQVGKDFPVFLHPKSKDEYALARTERKQGQGYTGFICDFTPDVTLEQDLIRRDLTVNAMALDEEGKVIDPYNGQQDLNDKVLRHVSDAFSEDPLRILRVARFAARYHYLDFTIAPETITLMTNMVQHGELNTLTKERVWLEVEKSLDDGAITVFFDVLAQIDGLEEISPSLASNWSSLSPRIKNTLNKLADNGNNPITQLSLCFTSQSQTALDEFSASMKMPNEFRDAISYFIAYTELFNQAELSAEELLQMFDKLDLWRRPNRLTQLLESVSALSEHTALQAKKAEVAAQKAQAVNVQDIIKQGFKGSQIKQQLALARRASIESAL